MLQVHGGTWDFRHRNKIQLGKNMQCDFWKRKLVTSIPTNQTWRPCPPFRRRRVSDMYPIIVFCLSEPRQQVASLAHIASLGSNQPHWCLVHFMIHHHYERKHNQPGMTSPAEIHSLPCSAHPALGTEAGYSLHRRATLLPGSKPSKLLVLETCWALMCSELQSPSELVLKFLKARNAAVVSLLIGWSSMASPALWMRAYCIHKKWLTRIGLHFSWNPLAWWRIEATPIVWLWTRAVARMSQQGGPKITRGGHV